VEAITEVAQRSEALGYCSVWTIERLLYPVKLQRPYPGTPDGHLPEIYKQALDPVDALTHVAAQTKKINLGTLWPMNFCPGSKPFGRRIQSALCW
jgi:alkanesulfonate monooxygenase SsuD/methylene tetrahydromethanopterin reductase-like flavin-dependent oxidoreductase (luciferase family)